MNVRFHLPGLRNNFPINMILIDLMKRYPKYFRENIEIASIFGEFPTSLWNGGRFSGGDQCDANYIKQVIKHINGLGIPIRYTFTNPIITEADLEDPYCNFCMKAGDNGKNEVLVVSKVLEEYIRKNYPSYTINSSTCKEIRSVESLNEELEKDYGLVVLDYNMNNDFEQLERVKDKERCEVLVNACCVPDCPRRGEHYKSIGTQQRVCLANRQLPPEKQMPIPKWNCEYGEQTSLYVSKNYSTHISPEDIWEKYLPMGFNNFKIEGRTANVFLLIDTYCYYFMKPEYRDEARFILTTNLVANKVVVVNKPKRGTWP